jgi:hypothetical protein
VFSVAVWLFVAMAIGGFVPVKYVHVRTEHGLLGSDMIFWNISYIYYGTGGIIFGILISLPLHRIGVVSLSQPHDRMVELSRFAHYGKFLCGWKILPLMVLAVFLYILGDNIAHKCYIVHPNVSQQELTVWPEVVDGHKQVVDAAPGDIDKLNYGLFYAAAKGDLDLAVLAISKGANANCVEKEYEGLSPLHMAVGGGHYEIVKYLISIGADVNARAPSGETAFDYAETDKMRSLLSTHGALTGDEIRKQENKKQGENKNNKSDEELKAESGR